MNQNFIDLIEREDLPGEMQMVADAIGIEKTRELIAVLGGVVVHIPQPKSLRTTIERFIVERFVKQDNGRTNAHELSRITGLSIRSVTRYAAGRRISPAG